VNRALRFTLLGLAVVVVLFAVTWLSLPGSDERDVGVPASLFIHGLTYESAITPTRGYGGATSYARARYFPAVRLDELKTRVAVFYGSAAAVIVLVGLAFGAGRRSPSTA
jgi:hypothetical protein